MVKIRLTWQERFERLMPRLLILSLLTNIFLMGGLMNLYTVSSNGGKMPVYTQESFDTGNQHFTFDNPEDVKAFTLSDIYHINLGNLMTLYYSKGDILVVSSLFIMIVYTITIFIYNTTYFISVLIKKIK